MSKFRLYSLLFLALAIVGFFVVQTLRWSGAIGAERAHQKFLQHIEDRRWSKCHGMISRDYADRWDFDREEISLALQDVGSFFVFSLTIDWDTKSISPAADGTGFDITGTARFDGRGSPGTDLVLRTMNAYSGEPFTFRWKREGLMPWKWKLVLLDHPTAEVPPGYTPGELRSSPPVDF